MATDPDNRPIIDAVIVRDDAYSAQRAEMDGLIKSRLQRNEPLVVHEQPRLTPDELFVILHKLRHDIGFSRKERSALTEAGFDLDRLYPDL